VKGRDHFEVLDVHGLMLEWNLEKSGGKVWIGFIWIRIGTIDGRNGNEPAGSIKVREYF
jgi:hypothetical protein